MGAFVAFAAAAAVLGVALAAKAAAALVVDIRMCRSLRDPDPPKGGGSGGDPRG